MNALVIEYATCADVVQVCCSKCGNTFMKQPVKTYEAGKGARAVNKYDYCPICGCFVDIEGYPTELEHPGAVGC